MLFNSFEYILFLILVLSVYLFLARFGFRAQNVWILLASYVFYGWWDWRFLALLFATSLNDYLVGLGLSLVKGTAWRRVLLGMSLALNFGALGFFKYFNFFISSMVEAFGALGIQLHAPTLRIILPVGISFYTFQSATYTISVYRRQIEPTRSATAFLGYVAFFPQLVAGPIERAGHLLPQFLSSRRITAEDVVLGVRQIVWGLFCKLVIADNCAVIVNTIFDRGASAPGSVVFISALFFAFQIYGDFAGYSHIAIGSARLFGFELMQNFATPYFSMSIHEFWRRWHISLSTWFRDYIYIPLGGNRVGKLRQALNILATFTISGFWHGANWTFVVWGFLNGLFCLPRLVIGEPLGRLASLCQGGARISITMIRVGITFCMTSIAWIFFRAENMASARSLLSRLFSTTINVNPVSHLQSLEILRPVLYAGISIAALVALEWLQRDKKFALEFDTWPRLIRWPAYTTVMALILILRHTGETLEFIYFQF